VVEALHTTFITPIDRNDIYTLISKMDDIMDMVEAAATACRCTRSAHDREVGDLARCLSPAPSMFWERCPASATCTTERDSGALYRDQRLENVADKILRSALARLSRKRRIRSPSSSGGDLRDAGICHRPLRGRRQHHRGVVLENT